MIRLAKREDIPAIIELAKECFPEFDTGSALEWLSARIDFPNFFIAIGDDAAALAYISAPFWEPNSPKFLIDFVACRRSRFGAANVLNVLKFLNDLRKSNGYDKTYVRAALADMDPFIKKLGGQIFSQTWVIGD